MNENLKIIINIKNCIIRVSWHYLALQTRSIWDLNFAFSFYISNIIFSCSFQSDYFKDTDRKYIYYYICTQFDLNNNNNKEKIKGIANETTWTWLQRGYLKRKETKCLSMLSQNISIRNNYEVDQRLKSVL